MKKMVLSILAASTALAAAAPASAAIFIGVGLNGGAITQVASDGGTGRAAYTTPSGLFGYEYDVSATGSPRIAQPRLLTQSLNLQQASGTGGTLNVYITQTDLASFNNFLASVFTSNSLTNSTARISSYFSTTNALWGGTLLSTANFTSNGSSSSAAPVNAASPFSTTVRYDITFGAGSGDFNGTANLGAVPEPATWGMMMLGFGAMGFALRRRRNVETRIRFA